MNIRLITPILFCLVLLLWEPHNSSWQALWIDRWALVLIALFSAALIDSLKSKLSRALALYVLVLGLLSGFTPYFHAFFAPGSTPEYQHAALSGLLCLFAFILFLKIPLSLVGGLRFAALLTFGGIVYAWFRGTAHTQVPFFSNPSMAATFVVLVFGALHMSRELFLDWGFWVAAGLSAMMTGRHVPLVVFGVMTLWSLQIKRRWVAAPILGSIVALALLGLPDNGRLKVWTMSWDFFAHQNTLHQLFGLGLGSTRVWLPVLGYANQQPQSFVWLHNDWLQILFELGLVGFGLVVAAAVKLYRKSSPENRTVLAGYGVAMCANFPLHWALTSLVLWSLIKETTDEI